MELELLAPRLSLIPAPVYLPAVPGLGWAACGELSWCRHLSFVAALCAALAEQQEGAGLLKGGTAIPLQEPLVFCNLHPAPSALARKIEPESRQLCLFPKKYVRCFFWEKFDLLASARSR